MHVCHRLGENWPSETSKVRSGIGYASIINDHLSHIASFRANMKTIDGIWSIAHYICHIQVYRVEYMNYACREDFSFNGRHIWLKIATCMWVIYSRCVCLCWKCNISYFQWQRFVYVCVCGKYETFIFRRILLAFRFSSRTHTNTHSYTQRAFERQLKGN